jgi:hypothetical protein
MRVRVVRMEEGESGLRTALLTEGGVVWTYWRGESPTAGQSVDVELAISAELTWGRELEVIADEDDSPGALTAGAALGCLHAVLERTEPDGAAVLRVSEGILLVFAKGEPPPPGTRLRVRGCEITAYPVHL